MKKGDQFYLEFEITDKNDKLLDIDSIKKVQFNIGELTKTYVSGEQNEQIIYDEQQKMFKVYITEEESFSFNDKEKVDVRVLFNNDLIMGSPIKIKALMDTVNKEEIYDQDKNA